jgi:hypothetical protein
MLRVGFSRFAVERCFEDDKTEIGLDHFEMRNYRSLKRHLAVSAASLMFLAEVQQEDREKKSGADSLPGPHGRQRHDRESADARRVASELFAKTGGENRPRSKEKRHGEEEPSQDHTASATRGGFQNISHDAMPA